MTKGHREFRSVFTELRAAHEVETIQRTSNRDRDYDGEMVTSVAFWQRLSGGKLLQAMYLNRSVLNLVIATLQT